MNNYRPISVISIIAKEMEKIAHNQLYLYLQNKNILSPSQNGFTQGHSTVTALLEITDKLYHNIIPQIQIVQSKYRISAT